uniref:Uncharacterized protein n=1 Tax=Ustilaginoidea virens TaxID=1159556 RepID=A0A063BWL5_USTVR|nr:hypothetical protein [Ustilaginoidea virens]
MLLLPSSLTKKKELLEDSKARVYGGSAWTHTACARHLVAQYGVPLLRAAALYSCFVLRRLGGSSCHFEAVANHSDPWSSLLAAPVRLPWSLQPDGCSTAKPAAPHHITSQDETNALPAHLAQLSRPDDILRAGSSPPRPLTPVTIRATPYMHRRPTREAQNAIRRP